MSAHKFERVETGAHLTVQVYSYRGIRIMKKRSTGWNAKHHYFWNIPGTGNGRFTRQVEVMAALDAHLDGEVTS
jgi:hypothetical protein